METPNRSRKTNSNRLKNENNHIKTQTRKRPPAKTPEARENQMIALAIDLAEKQLMEGTATSQVITHYLKLGTIKEGIEKEILLEQKELIKAKRESIASAKVVEELYSKAIDAMKIYTGNSKNNEEML